MDAHGNVADLPDPLAATHTYADALVSAIPTEVLALYTFVVTEVVGTITSPTDDKHLRLRWITFAAGFAAIVLYLGASYSANAINARRRKAPVTEILSAGIAFGAWGLVMPGSPLMAMLSASNTRIWTAIITAAGVFLLALSSGRLAKPSTSAR